MSEVASPVTGKPYGLAAVCRAWRIARSGIYRHRTAPSSAPRRRGPMGALSDAALTAAIKAVLAASPFHGEGHRKVWARLRYAGIRTSLRRVLRLMREHHLLAPGRVGSPRGPRSHDGTIVPDTIDTMWGTDLTATFTGEGPAAVFIAVDHCSAECVGIHVSVVAAAHGGAVPCCDARRGWMTFSKRLDWKIALIRVVVRAHVARGWRSSLGANAGALGRWSKNARSSWRA